MSKLATLAANDAPPAIPGCARAVVTEVDDLNAITLRRADGVSLRGARCVLGLPVTPRVGDGVLVVDVLAEGDGVEPWIVAVTTALREAPPPAPMTVTRDETGTTVLRFAPGPVALEADGDLTLRASRRVALEADEAQITARRFETAARIARHAAELVETRASRVVVRAASAYHEIEGLMQTRAARVRTVAAEAMHLAARRILAKGDDDVKLKGGSIHLG